MRPALKRVVSAAALVVAVQSTQLAISAPLESGYTPPLRAIAAQFLLAYVLAFWLRAAWVWLRGRGEAMWF